MDIYYTIEKSSEGIFKDKGSKFYAFAYPVDNEEQIKEILNSIKKKYYDARHHCFAYMLGADKKKYRANDDGEPSSTAGKPVLGQIRSKNLTNILIIVVRYFGGTLLGVGGLINAYRNAAADSLANATVIKKTVKNTIAVRFNYEDMNAVMRIIKEENLEQIKRDFAENCLFHLSMPKSKTDHVKERLQFIKSTILE